MIGAAVAKDPLSTFLLWASIGLVIIFFVLLAYLSPPRSGNQFPISRVISLAQQHQIADATLLDHDARVIVDTFDGQRFYANYPSSGAATQQLVTNLTQSGARVVIDPQSGKPTAQILVQFLIPIVLLVCLFAFFTRVGADGGAGGIAAFSKFTGSGKRKGKGTLHRTRSTTSPVPARRWPSCGRSGITWRIRADTSRSARPRRRVCCSSDLPGPARRCSPRRSPARPTRRSSRCRARTSSSHLSVSAPPGSATCFARRARRPRRSSSSTSSMRPAANAGPASARATTSASRR